MAARQKKKESKSSKRAAKRAAAAKAKAQKTQRPGSGGGYEYKPPKRKPIVSQAEMDRRIAKARKRTQPGATGKIFRAGEMATPGPTKLRLRDIGDRFYESDFGRSSAQDLGKGPKEGVSEARTISRRKELERKSFENLKKSRKDSQTRSRKFRRLAAKRSVERRVRERAKEKAVGKSKKQVLGPHHDVVKPPVQGARKPPVQGPDKPPRLGPDKMVQGANLPSKYDKGFLGPLKKFKKPKIEIPEGVVKRTPRGGRGGGVAGVAASVVIPYLANKAMKSRSDLEKAKKRKAAEEESPKVKPTKFKKARTVSAPKAKSRRRKRRSTEPASWNQEAGVSDDL